MEKGGHADPYVTLRLMPSGIGQAANGQVPARQRHQHKSRKHTRVVQNSLQPHFDERQVLGGGLVLGMIIGGR